VTDTRVVNVKREACEEYVGRPFGKFKGHPGTFGNPFRFGGKPVQELESFIYGSALRLNVGTRSHFEQMLTHEAWRVELERSDALAAFHLYLVERCRVDREWREKVQALKGKALGCWCKPSPCHADVLAAFVDGTEMRELGRVLAPIRGLTLIRPWGWAIAHAGKDVENRTWEPPRGAVGGWLAIHSGEKYDQESADWMRDELELDDVPVKRADPAGVIVAVAQLAEVVTESASEWWAGPFGWRLENVTALPSPVPCKGALGLWKLPVPVLTAVRAGWQQARKGHHG
jgi:hypothetical protein